jgi:hypothetical protein
LAKPYDYTVVEKQYIGEQRQQRESRLREHGLQKGTHLGTRTKRSVTRDDGSEIKSKKKERER